MGKPNKNKNRIENVKQCCKYWRILFIHRANVLTKKEKNVSIYLTFFIAEFTRLNDELMKYKQLPKMHVFKQFLMLFRMLVDYYYLG